MFRIDRIEDRDNCLDSSPVKEIFLCTSVDEETMRCAAHRGRLQYFPDFPKPYFRIDRNSSWVIQGVIGSSSLRITLSTTNAQDKLAELCDLLEGRMESDGEIP